MEEISFPTATLDIEGAPTGTPRIVGLVRACAFVVVGGATLLAAQPDVVSASWHSPSQIFVSALAAERTPAVPDQLASLNEQWGDADTIPVSEPTIEGARTLLQNLPPGTEHPHLAPSSDGEIGLSWVRGGDRFEAMLHPDGHLVWVTKVSGKFEVGMDVDFTSSAGRDAFYTALGGFYEQG
jgi:hypothetical protein